MQMKYYLLIAFLAIIPMMTAQCQQPEDHCQYYYNKLKDLPHEKLDYQKGTITFLWDRKEYKGCEVRFATHDSLLTDHYKLPNFVNELDPVLYKKGWRYNLKYMADGTDSMVYGVEKENILCLLHHSYTIWDDTVDPVQVSDEKVVVQCLPKNVLKK